MGNVSHDSGTPAASMPGMIGAKWANAATPENPLKAIAISVTTT